MNLPPLPPGLICSPEDYAQSIADSSSLYCLGRGDSIGLTITAAAGLASLIALLYVFRLIAINLNRHWRGAETRIFEKPLDVLMLALFIADTLQAIGGALNIHWIGIGKVQVGDFCRAQGIIQNAGETGVALSNIWITTFTLYNILTGQDPSMRSTFLTIGCSCILLILLITLGNTLTATHASKYIVPTPYWCWINSHYRTWQLFAEYLWLWIALFWSILVYILLYLFHRGHIILGQKWWDISFRLHPQEGEDAEVRSLGHDTSTMLWYPLTYGLVILPVTIIRFIGFARTAANLPPLPATATFVFIPIFTLSGFFNVILLKNTRPDAGLFGSTPAFVPEVPDVMELWPQRPAAAVPEEAPQAQA